MNRDRLEALLPPAWRWIVGGDAMLTERDQRRIERRNQRVREEAPTSALPHLRVVAPEGREQAARREDRQQQTSSREEEVALCDRLVYWWDGEYEGNCVLPVDHDDDDHWDGMSWFNDDNECTDSDHEDT